MEIIFFISLFLSVYSYIIYPVLIYLLSKVFRQVWRRRNCYPSVTLIISAYNEEKDIAAKIHNSLQLRYPEDRLEIIVSSDGSTDKTNDIVAAIPDKRLILRDFRERLGKTACLNKVVPEAHGEIILFTDANSIFAQDTLQQIVKNFYDQSIGGVTGWTKYHNVESGEETTGIYARLEKKTKLDESLISSCVGADGAVFAIRKELYVPLRADDINDFIIPLNVIKQAKRVVLDPAVFCVEEETKGIKNIFKRQVRITTRTAWALRRNLRLLNFVRYGSFSFFLLSHKILRLATPFFLLAAFTLNLSLLNESLYYMVFPVSLLLFLSLALASAVGIAEGRIASICKYFVITLAAHFLGCLRMLSGIEDIMWTPKR
jgi:cellulose synthase/poly-beta-1,6-N-acetylglucosamine synthase-like glycosyltransferase